MKEGTVPTTDADATLMTMTARSNSTINTRQQDLTPNCCTRSDIRSYNSHPEVRIILRHLFASMISFVVQTYLSDEDDDLYLSPVMRKKAVKVKHVKRREKKFDKKVRITSLFIITTVNMCDW